MIHGNVTPKRGRLSIISRPRPNHQLSREASRRDAHLAVGETNMDDAKLHVIGAGGFRSVRRAAETPFNMILEARP
jgi:hypothetical protein